MARHLRLPALLSVVVLSATACGGGSKPDPDARVVDATPDAVVCPDFFCVPDGTGTGDECPYPTCSTGPTGLECPEHCQVA
jgi:hypothetical protein